MIYLIDNGFRVNIALDLLVNQVQSHEGFKKCLCLGFKVKNDSNSNDNQGTCFADDNGNVN